MLAALLLLAAAMADFGGEWRATLAAGPRHVEFVFDLKQSDQSITGTVTMADQAFSIEGGNVQGSRISFFASIPKEGRLMRLPFTGELKGVELRLQMGGAALLATRIQREPQALRIERLAGLFRAWGTIKFFHPYLAYRPIDWDGALMAAIPKVEAAKTTEEYAAAVDAMLKEIKDPETHVLRGPMPDSIPTAESQRRLVRAGYVPQIGNSASGYYTDWETVKTAAPYVIELPANVRVGMRTSEPVSSSTGISTVEKPYGDSLPTREQRLLALARFWNTIRYFYGYQDNIPSWDAVLPEFLAQFESASNWRDYVFAIARLASRTHDSHTFIGEFWKELGATPDVELWPIEGQSVVKNVGPGVAGIERGDIILNVDGEAADRRRQFLLDMYPHSTRQAGLLMINQFLLAGHQPSVKVRVWKADGREAEMTLARSGTMDWSRSTPVYEVLSSGFGYIDLARLGREDVSRAFDAVMKTPGLIFDLRGSPQGTFDMVASRLAEKKVPAAIVSRRVWHGPEPAMSAVKRELQYVYPSDGPKYKGRVVVLIDARAISQAEHMCLFLEAAAKVTFVGSPTKGADGEVTNTVLPGGIQVNFAALEARHADGRPLQRVGILPDVWVEPTVSGIRQGRDEVLEKAIELLRE